MHSVYVLTYAFGHDMMGDDLVDERPRDLAETMYDLQVYVPRIFDDPDAARAYAYKALVEAMREQCEEPITELIENLEWQHARIPGHEAWTQKRWLEVEHDEIKWIAVVTEVLVN